METSEEYISTKEVKTNPEMKSAGCILFDVLMLGEFSVDQLKFSKVEPGSTIKRTKESEEYITREWDKLLESGFKAWANDTKPSRYKLVDFKTDGGNLSIVLDPCVSYRDYVGGCNPEFMSRYKGDIEFNPLAVTVLIVGKTKDGEECIVITLRQQSHDYKPNGFHASVGGWVDTDKSESPIDASYREIREEIGVERSDLGELQCKGIVYDPWVCHSDIIFQTNIDIPIEKIEDKTHDDENQLFYISTDANKLRQWILDVVHAGVPSGVSALLLFGKERHGEDWYCSMINDLTVCCRNYDQQNVRAELERRDAGRLSDKIDVVD